MGFFREWQHIFRSILGEGKASDKAHEMGLTSAGGAYWQDEFGNIVAKTVNDELVKIEKGEVIPPPEQRAQQPAPPEPTPSTTIQPVDHQPQAVPDEPKPDTAKFDTMSTDELLKYLTDHGHTLEDTIDGLYPAYARKFKDEDLAKAQASGLFTAVVKGVGVYAKDEASAQPLIDFFKKGGKMGSTESMRLLGYTKEEVGAYTRYLKRIDRYDLLGKGTGNQFTGGGGKSSKRHDKNDSWQGKVYGSGRSGGSGGSYFNSPYSGGSSSHGSYTPYDPKNEPHKKKAIPVPEGGIEFLKDTQVPSDLNGIPFSPWLDAPVSESDWANVEGQNEQLSEPPMPLSLKKQGAGVIIQEPDGRVWVIEPHNHYMGVEHTLPKGTKEKGLTLQQTAIKEAYEETGLKVKITGFFGDYDRDSSVARYYTAQRVGGSPNDFGWETRSVKLVKPEDLPKLFNKMSDQGIAKDISSGKKAEPTTAAEILFKKVGGQKGTNEGGFYEGADGRLRYVKRYQDPSRAQSENLANEIYRALGLGAPKSRVFPSEGKTLFASDIIEGDLLKQHKLDKKLAENILDGFAADVLVGNWDTVGLVHDNVLIDKEGKVNRIDNGGCFLFRAQEASGRKPDQLLDKITEWDGFAKPNINPAYSKIFQAAGIEKPEDLGWNLIYQVDDLTRLRTKANGWDAVVQTFAPKMNPEDRQKIVQMLETRYKLIKAKADALEKTLPKPQTKWSGGSSGQSNSTNIDPTQSDFWSD